jgi:prepilin signal peptidase PulO-like enzyme (type II secretory pathway)
MPTLILSVWAILGGLCFGSFINVVALRDGERFSILNGRSRCPHCRHHLRWFELIPLLSFLWQRGKCRNCRRAIGWRYPLVELMVAALTWTVFWYGYLERGSIWLTAGLLVSLLLFTVVSLVDLASMEVPLDYVVAAGAVGALARVGSGEVTGESALIGALVGGISIASVLFGWRWLFRRDGMGEGDIWIAAAIGSVAGFPQVAVALMTAVFLGAAVGLLAIGWSEAKQGRSRRGKEVLLTPIPFGPFLAAGLLISLLWGESLLNWYLGWYILGI